MTTINKKYKPEITTLRKEIANRRDEEEKWFIALCKKLKINPDSESEILYLIIFTMKLSGP